MTTPRVLVVDDEKLVRWAIAEALRKDGFEVEEAADGERGFEIAKTSWVDIVLLDVRLPGMSGMELLRSLKEEGLQCVVIMMTAFSEVKQAVEAMKLGAFDYLIKPLEPEAARVIVNRALEHKRLTREVAWRRRNQKQSTFDDIVAESQVMKDTVAHAKRVAASRSLTVLLVGDTGTGKDLFAQAIHSASERNTAPFVTINCSALPESLLESELLGYEKGAFTDARTSKEGLFELADGGTVYLDEIAEMKTNLQTKLLRLIEEKSFRRLGGRRDIDVDVRIVAATNRDVERAVKDGLLREDLYYRLKVVPIRLSSLRERREDIPHLATRFVELFCEESHRTPVKLSPEVVDLLVAYDWPGNVRELKNLLERLVLLEREDTIQVHHLPLEVSSPATTGFYHGAAGAGALTDDHGVSAEPAADSRRPLHEVERQLILEALQKSGGNQVQAAKLLGISRDTLRYRIKKHGIEKTISW